MSDAGRRSPEPGHRIGTLRGFLPLSEETILSTRNQALPSLVRNLSDRNLSALHPSLHRHSSSNDRIDYEAGHASAPQSPSEHEGRRLSVALSVLMTPQMRSQRLIGNSNPRYQWEQYWRTEEELKSMKRPVREYYERNNYLIQQYVYIDRLLDSSLPHNLIQEYNQPQINVPKTISEEPSLANSLLSSPELTANDCAATSGDGGTCSKKVKRTPRDIYKVPDEETPLLPERAEETGPSGTTMPPIAHDEEDVDSQSGIVKFAIYVNMAANALLLILKIIVTVLTSSVSVLASLVDAALDFLSTAIVWTTGWLISRKDEYSYPVGRRRLEPIGVLVFSIVMITSFFQVALEGFNRILGSDHTIIQLTVPAIAIMVATVIIKGLCWVWCRLIKNSSVQMLAEDAKIDVVFNSFSIIFPLVGYYAKIWWLDSLGGILLSLYVVFNWSRTSATHIRNLTGAAASADERNVLLYLTMRFAKTIKQIQGLQAYHSGDKLTVEVDVVLDEYTSLRDSHDLGESLQYVLESVPNVDRAFVHLDYTGYNIPTHMQQQE